MINLFYKTVFLYVTLLLLSASSIAQEANVYHNITTKIAFRGWTGKTLGDVIDTDTISVITSPNGPIGEIVILRWSDDKTHFTTEVYKADPDQKNPEEWILVSETEDKALTDQHGQFFLILELIYGPEGGQRTERFSLTN